MFLRTCRSLKYAKKRGPSNRQNANPQITNPQITKKLALYIAVLQSVIIADVTQSYQII
jgi:hypothetical protein